MWWWHGKTATNGVVQEVCALVLYKKTERKDGKEAVVVDKKKMSYVEIQTKGELCRNKKKDM